MVTEGATSMQPAKVAAEREQPTWQAMVRRAPGMAELDPAKHHRRSRLRAAVLPFVVPVVGFVLWEVAARNGWIDERFFSRPSLMLESARDLIKEGQLQEDALVSIRRLVIGYVVGSVSGVVVGLVLSQLTIARQLFEPTLRALYVVPKLALLPVLLLVFGIGETPKLIFVALGVFFILAFTTLSAASLIPTPYHEVAATFGLTRLQRFRWVVFAAALPHIVAALKLASGVAVLLVVAVEFIQSNDGLGYLTWHSWELFRADRMYVGIVTISVIGVIFGSMVSYVGRRLVPWSTS